jgi:hypothetical protein
MATCHHKTEVVGTAMPLGAVAMYVTCLALIQAFNGSQIRSSGLCALHMQGHVLTDFQCAPRA